MPVTLKKLKSGKVRVSTPHGVKSKGSTPANAERQKRLLNAIEHNPDFKPRGAARDKFRKHAMKSASY